MIVERLIPDAHRPGSTRIVVDGRPAWTVPADVVAGLRLAEGGPIRGDALERLDRAADEEAAFRAALRALERRAHGERELARKLERKGHTAPAIVAAITRLCGLDLLDDLAFARAYVTSRSERGRGPGRLRRDLALLGVPRAIAEQALGEIEIDGDDPLARPRGLVLRRAAQLAAYPAAVRRRRLLAFLARRGYRGHAVLVLVEEALVAQPEPRTPRRPVTGGRPVRKGGDGL
ncbi:MAG: regulatory protein RecX [Gemmatimonadales bacterium]